MTAQSLNSVLAGRPYAQRNACFEPHLTQELNIARVSTNFCILQDRFVHRSSTDMLN